jgi:hypothetical protein
LNPQIYPKILETERKHRIRARFRLEEKNFLGKSLLVSGRSGAGEVFSGAGRGGYQKSLPVLASELVLLHDKYHLMFSSNTIRKKDKEKLWI